MNDMVGDFPSLLRAARKKQNWSQAELANKVEADLSTVKRWENGTGFPRPYHRAKLCEVFSTDNQALGLEGRQCERKVFPLRSQSEESIQITLSKNTDHLSSKEEMLGLVELPNKDILIERSVTSRADSEDVVTADILRQNESLNSIGDMPKKTPWLEQRRSGSQVASPKTVDRIRYGQNRSKVLQFLRKDYTDALAASLQETARIEPRLHERFDLTHLNRSIFFHPGQEEREFPIGTSIVTVYNETRGGGLLILGAPGAGKTTLLYELAQHLLQHAQHDEEAPLPFVLNLSSWTRKRQPLHEWVLKALELRYFIPQKLGQRWIQEERLLLLLDGLDEVAPSAYAACIETINSYYAAHPLPHIVCTRQEEYMKQMQRLTLQSAVVVQPLSIILVEEYLVKIGEPVAALHKAIRTNIVLQELLTTPLMLSIIVRAYYNKVAEDLPQMGTSEEQQHEVFARYLRQRLQDPNKSVRYLPGQMQKWLVWLAFQMKQRNQSLLYLEQLQPDLLPHGWSRRCYLWIGIYLPHIIMGMSLGIIFASFFFKYRLYSILSSGAYGGVIAGLLSYRYLSGALPRSSEKKQSMPSLFRRASLVSVVWSLVIATYDWCISKQFPYILYDILIFGIWMLILALLVLGENSSFLSVISLLKREGEHKHSWRSLFMHHSLKYFLLKLGSITLVSGLCIGIDFGLVSGVKRGLDVGLNYGLSNGLLFIVLNFLIATDSASITLKEMITWSLKRLQQAFMAKNHMRNVLLLSGSAIFVIGLSNGLNTGLGAGLGNGLVWGLCIGVIYWLFAGLLQSISSDQYQSHQRVLPNQGIGRSGSNGLLLGCIGSLIATLICGVSIVLSDALSTGLSDALSIGLSAGFSTGLRYGLRDGLGYIPWLVLAIGLFMTLLQGGSAWWRHWILRILLWRTGLLPLRLVYFLNTTTDRVLLYKVGGGYRFIHNLFRDFLTS